MAVERQIYLTLSTYREHGLDGRMLQYFRSLSYRFQMTSGQLKRPGLIRPERL